MIPPDQSNEQTIGQQPSGWLRKVTGWGLLAAGIAGCILPVIPGFPLVIAGLLILARDYVWAKRALHRAKRWAVHARRKMRARRAGTPAAGNGVSRKGAEEI
jgi:uncharacterized membrane protein YbaN (DUF454 family)